MELISGCSSCTAPIAVKYKYPLQVCYIHTNLQHHLNHFVVNEDLKAQIVTMAWLLQGHAWLQFSIMFVMCPKVYIICVNDFPDSCNLQIISVRYMLKRMTTNYEPCGKPRRWSSRNCWLLSGSRKQRLRTFC